MSSTNASAAMIMIDGSHGEGGGQILRNAISLACILKKNITITNIRANRKPKPGLKAQHMTGLQLCTKIAATGTLTGCHLMSEEISYSYNSDHSNNNNNSQDDEQTAVITGDTKTAGSICLLLQAALPVALFTQRCARLKLVLKGGTNATFAPQYDYWERVFLPTLERHFRLESSAIQPTVTRRGYFPQGGGHVEVAIQPLINNICLPPLNLVERGDVTHISIRSYYAGNISSSMARQMTDAAISELQKNQNLCSPKQQPTVEIVHETNAVGSGYGILLVAETTTGCRLAGSALGQPQKRKRSSSSSGNDSLAAAAAVGRAAAQELLDTLNDGGCTDEWLQDQLIIFMALANGESKLVTGSLTLHTRTAIWLAETITEAKFQVTRISSSTEEDDNEAASPTTDDGYGKDGRISGKHLICCMGVGFSNVKLSD